MAKQLLLACLFGSGCLAACAPSLQSSLPEPSDQASTTPTALPSFPPSPEPSSDPNHPCPTLFKTPKNLDLPIEKVKLTRKDSGEALNFKPQGICNSPDGRTLYVLANDQVWVTDAQTLQATPLFETVPEFVKKLTFCVSDTQSNLYLYNRVYSSVSKASRLYRYHLKEENFVFLDQGKNQPLMNTVTSMVLNVEENLYLVNNGMLSYLDKQLKAHILEADYEAIRNNRVHILPDASVILEKALNRPLKNFPLGDDISSISFALNKMYLVDRDWKEKFVVDESQNVTVLPTLEGRSLNEPNKIMAVSTRKLLHEPKRDIFLTLSGSMGWFSPHEGCHQNLNPESAKETYVDFTLSYDDYAYMVAPNQGIARTKIPEDLGKIPHR